MKRIIFGAMAAAALLSCSKEQVLETNQNGHGFKPSVDDWDVWEGDIIM